jgi:hypothetical protein
MELPELEPDARALLTARLRMIALKSLLIRDAARFCVSMDRVN